MKVSVSTRREKVTGSSVNAWTGQLKKKQCVKRSQDYMILTGREEKLMSSVRETSLASCSRRPNKNDMKYFGMFGF